MKIGKYNIDSELVIKYIKHLNTISESIDYNWEKRRKILHNDIFKSIKLDRYCSKGIKFSKELDLFCEDMISNPLIRNLKKLSICKDINELEVVKKEYFESKTHSFDNLQYKWKQKCEESTHRCRICDRDLSEVYPRVNTQMCDFEGIETPLDAICYNCFKNNPDKHAIRFREVYWNKK